MPSFAWGNLKPVLVLPLLGAVLGGCTTSAAVSYGEYRSGPGFETERVYENRIYGDTAQGWGGESCQVIARRQVDAFGEVAVREETVCNGLE